MAIVDMSKIDPNSFRALIVGPDRDANKDFKVTLEAIRDALIDKSIPYQELLYKNATWDNISIALQGGNLNYVYWVGHMNSQIGEERDRITRKVLKEGVHRTNFKCWKIRRFWIDTDEDRIFSCLGSDGIIYPSVPDTLPKDWEIRGHSMRSLGLWQTNKIKEFWAIGCESGLEWKNGVNTYNFNDMANAVGAHYKDPQGNYVHVYMGNRTPVWTGWFLPEAEHYPAALAGIIRNHGNNHSLEHALINGPHSNEQRAAVWGDDLNRDGWADNVLQWWPLNTKLDWIQFF